MKFVTSAGALVAAMVAMPAWAQSAPTGTETGAPTAPITGATEPASEFTVTGSAAIVSQYRFRGISQSDNKPAVQGSFTVAHASGLYVSAWGSSASANDAVNLGGTEIDIYGGFAKSIGNSGVTVDVGVYGYIYPGSKRAIGINENYYEIYGSLSKSFGGATVKAGVYWAPDQRYFDAFGTPSQHNVYKYGDVSYGLSGLPINLHAHVGHSAGGFNFAGHNYFDYSVGAGYKWKALTFDVSYVGTDLSRDDTRAADLALGTRDFRRAAKPVVVGSVTASF